MCDQCSPPGSPALFGRRHLFGGAFAFGAFVALGATKSASAARSPAALLVAEELAIYPRDAWADQPPKWAMSPEDVRFLLVHHTAGAQPASQDVPAELRSIYDFHTGPTKGWPDVCYNFFVDPAGGVWEGRAGSLAGPVEASATGGSQGFAQLVCLLGDFTSVMPTDAALASLARTLVWLAGRYAIDPDPAATVSFVSRGSNKWPAGAEVVAATISGHRDMSSTACPGDTFYPYLVSEMRARVFAAAGGVPIAPQPTTTVPPPTTTTTTVPETTTTTTTVPETTTTTTTVPETSAPRTTDLPSMAESPESTAASATSPGGLAPNSGTAAADEDGSEQGDPGGGSGRWLAVAGVAALAAGGGGLALARRRGDVVPDTPNEDRTS